MNEITLDMNKELLTKMELCELLEIPARSLDNWLVRKKITFEHEHWSPGHGVRLFTPTDAILIYCISRLILKGADFKPALARLKFKGTEPENDSVSKMIVQRVRELYDQHGRSINLSEPQKVLIVISWPKGKLVFSRLHPAKDLHKFEHDSYQVVRVDKCIHDVMAKLTENFPEAG